jgi:hypothetical protein
MIAYNQGAATWAAPLVLVRAGRAHTTNREESDRTPDRFRTHPGILNYHECRMAAQRVATSLQT